MFGIEKELFQQIAFLKNEYSLSGIKAEFEAEGSSFNDIVRSSKVNITGGS